ncbi:MAG: hypothetical protein N3A61_06170 [Ignavibacteria bacterium]|nr:hypothetical protein [Ignavibacteria bacterium]
MKKALITGGAKRLGKSIAIALSELNFDISITYNSSKDELDDLRKSV